MKKASSYFPDKGGNPSTATPQAHGSHPLAVDTASSLPAGGSSSSRDNHIINGHQLETLQSTSHNGLDNEKPDANGSSAFNTPADNHSPGPSPKTQVPGPVLGAGEHESKTKSQTIMDEIRRNAKLAISYSWLNLGLVFVPVGIAVAQVPGIHGGVVFAMNAIAIIPLAGLLAFSTESVARKMGDALGALLNVTFGNAVELIIFIIALVKNEIRIVQASLLGSILANLLLILGMGFFLGGLRFREQIYNSTVTQMSACLLSLSVISLVLPTAFHASFSDSKLADEQSLKISRGTSVILLLVYIIYLLFQLKSHAYMYESTPQHIVDAESTPGPAAGWLDSSSDSSSSSSSDSENSDSSRDTMKKKMKKVLRGGRRRKSSLASIGTNDTKDTSEASTSRAQLPQNQSVDSDGDEQAEETRRKFRRKHRRRRHRHERNAKKGDEVNGESQGESQGESHVTASGPAGGEPRRVDFAVQAEENEQPTPANTRSGFPMLRGVSVKNLAPTVFTQPTESSVGVSGAPSGPVPRVRYGIRRTNSLPGRLSQNQFRAPGAMFPPQVPMIALANGAEVGQSQTDEDEHHLSRAGSIVLLLLSTALVAVCAEFLVDSIEEVVSTSSVGEIFIGLIILPIVGNAAEHVTAITVAMKNKMDLAIGVAVGSSIQIAIFITPLVVILGWIMDRDMSLYFTLFETVCLFVSAFIVNFLVLDGRSNYLEGALLCAVYLIIAVVAYFYPDPEHANTWG